MPALPKLVLDPNCNSFARVGSALLIWICGKVFAPSKFIPKSLGENACPVFEYARSRVKPARCSHVRAGVRITVLLIEATWLPASSVCGKPNKLPTAPKGFVVGLSWIKYLTPRRSFELRT